MAESAKVNKQGEFCVAQHQSFNPQAAGCYGFGEFGAFEDAGQFGEQLRLVYISIAPDWAASIRRAGVPSHSNPETTMLVSRASARASLWLLGAAHRQR